LEIFLLSFSHQVPRTPYRYCISRSAFAAIRRRACVWHPRFSSDRCQLFEISCMGQHTPVHPYHHARPHDACRRDLSGVRGYFVIMVSKNRTTVRLKHAIPPNPTAICQKSHVQGLGLPWGWRGGAEGASERNGRHTVGSKGPFGWLVPAGKQPHLQFEMLPNQPASHPLHALSSAVSTKRETGN
jgi:hypothetical protein